MSKIFHVAQQHNDTHVNFTLAELILIKQKLSPLQIKV